MIRASLWVKSTRVGELLGDVVGCFRGNQGLVGHWHGMAMFMNNPVAADDPRLAIAYDNYRRNLTDICRTAPSGAAVVLSTVAVNLRDFPPLASLHRSDLAAQDLAQWVSLYKTGRELQADNRWPEALQQYEAAAKIDDRFAELQFHIGECLLKTGRAAEAGSDSKWPATWMCCGSGPIPASMPSSARWPASRSGRRPLGRCRKCVRSAGRRYTSKSEGDLFYEHVHLTFDGNYLLARAVFDEACAALPQLAGRENHRRHPLAAALRGVAGADTMGRVPVSG